MPIDKKKTIASHQSHKKDTGSPQVQIAIMTKRIAHLTEHLKTHKKDKHSRRGLIGLVGKRRRLLRYLQMQDKDLFRKVVDDLKIRA